MKTTNQILFLIAFMSLMACKQSPDPVKGPKLPVTIYSSNIHVVTLYVDTDINDRNSFEYANFGQDKKKTSNKDFTTYVRNGDIVLWKGVSLGNPLDVVKITSINYEDVKNDKYINFFSTNSLKGNGGKNQMVVGAIKKAKKGYWMKYSLDFVVHKKGEEPSDTLNIDPKMHM